MANKLFLLSVILIAGLGCGIIDRARQEATGESNTAANINANKTFTDKAVDTAVGEQKVGIQECDEALDILAAQANNPDDNFLVKAGKKTALNAFRDHLKKSLEQSNTNKVDVARYCKDFRDNLDESLQEQENSNTAK